MNWLWHHDTATGIMQLVPKAQHTIGCPFGMAFAESTTAEQSSQPYKYNGKELDDTHGLNWYDYSARFYDPGYITTPTPDTHSENYYSWSPYVYVGNNPMKYIDPLGTDTTHFEFNTGRIQAVNPGGEDAMSTILPEVTVKGQNPWRYGEEGGVYKLSNKERGITLTLGEKPLNMVNIEFDILLMGRLAVNAASSVAASAVAAEKIAAKGGNNIVYLSVENGVTQYAGITNNLARRAAEHLAKKGIRIEPLMKGLSRSDARAVEQALIEIHGLQKNGGTLINKINSISPTSSEYGAQLQRRYELLKTIGYH